MASPFSPSNTTLIVDVSKYVPGYDLNVLKAGGVRGIIARIGEGLNDVEDPTWAGYVQAAHNAGLPCMGYYVIHPEYIDNAPGCVTEHLKRIKKFVANKDIRGIWIDCEIYKDANGKAIAPAWISERTRSLIDETQKAFPNLVVGLYTGGWFVDAYAPAIKQWAYKYPLWWAYYTVTQTAQVEWADLKNYYPTALPKNLIVDPSGNGKLTVWQWSGDKLKLPGMTDANGNRIAADLNFYMGGEAAWYEFAKWTPTGEPTPEPEPEPDPDPVDTTALVAALNANTAAQDRSAAQAKRLADWLEKLNK